MSEETKWISRRRLLAGLITLGGASAAAGGGTMAAIYSDQEYTRNNEVEAGQLNLTFGTDDSILELGATLNTNESTSGSVDLVNADDATGSVDVAVEYAENDSATDNNDKKTAQEVAQNLAVTTLEYGNTDLLTDSSQGLPNPCTLADLEANNIEGSEDLANLDDPGGGTTFTIELELGGNVNQSNGQFAGEGIDVWLVFSLNQTDVQ